MLKIQNKVQNKMMIIIILIMPFSHATFLFILISPAAEKIGLDRYLWFSRFSIHFQRIEL
jgi:hypothetical protein